MKIVMISDTHTKHRQIDMPDGDLLLHAGDFSHTGSPEDVFHFNTWLGEIKHKYKYGVVVIAGNHEKTFCPRMREYDPNVKDHIKNAIYLENSSVEINGLKIYGSPISPFFYNWGFNRHRGEEIREDWANIPDDTNILIVHGPPYGFNDKVRSSLPLGCEDLRDRIEQLPNLRLICSGHIHDGYGLTKWKDKTYVNASIVNEAYKVANEPIVVTYLEDGILT